MSGTLYGIGVGPGDPELMTLKALRILQACPVVAYPAPDTGPSLARSIAAPHLTGTQQEIAIVVPMRVERFPARQVYDRAAEDVGRHLHAGRDVAVLCEGDPFFYGSFMYLYERLAGRYPCEVVPGISSMMAAGAVLGQPLAARNDVLTVLPGPLADDDLRAALSSAQAVCIIKVGRHLARIRALLEHEGWLDEAWLLERVTMGAERRMRLRDVDGDTAPYFSIVLAYRGAEPWIGSLPLEATEVA